MKKTLIRLENSCYGLRLVGSRDCTFSQSIKWPNKIFLRVLVISALMEEPLLPMERAVMKISLRTI